MNDITPTGSAPRKQGGTIVIILVILIILVAGIALSMHGSTQQIAPVSTTDSMQQSPTSQSTTPPSQSPDTQVQNVDSLNSNLDNQQFEGTSSTFQ